MQNPFEVILEELAAIRERMDSISPNPPAPVEIIDRPELLKRLALTEPTVIRYEKKGKIPVIRIGSSVRYNWQAVIKALEK